MDSKPEMIKEKQGELFNRAAGAIAATEAIERVEKHADRDWLDIAMLAVERVAARAEFFTSDAVWFEIKEIDDAASTHEPRAMGAVMRRAASMGIVAPTDRYETSARTVCHNRGVRVWRSLRLRVE